MCGRIFLKKMKFSARCFLCVCMMWISSCQVNSVTQPATVQTSTQTSGATSREAVTFNTATFTFSLMPYSVSRSTSYFSAWTSSATADSTEEDNNTSTSNSTSSSTSSSTSPTTQPTTTTQMLTFCKNGTCVGNDSSCLNETISDTCMLSESQSCYQIVYTNETDTHYEVGCSSNCEFLVEETEAVTKTTRCCETSLCNNVLLEDPDQENNAVQICVPCYSILLLLYLSMLFN